VARILEQKVRFNVYDLSKTSWGLGSPKTTYQKSGIGNDTDHIALAQKAALESMVLLKNDNNTLPIKSSVTKVAVLGATVPYQTLSSGRAITSSINFATDVTTGDLGTSAVFHDPAKGIGPFTGIKLAAPSGVTVVTGASAADAADADFVVVVAGLTAQDEGEEYTGAGDRVSLGLDAKQADPQSQNIQNNLIASVAALGKPMVVVLEGGSVIDMPWLDQVPALVMAWYPGMVGGAAMGQLLWGQANFSGKLPFTWGKLLADYPVFKDDSGNTTFDYYAGYRYFDHYNIAPLLPFGYGKSYTTIEYRKLDLPCTAVTSGAAFPVTVTVANTGTMDADEIVMVFVSFPNSKARRPAKELKGFARATLKAGEEKAVTILIRTTDLDYWDALSSQWVIESDTVTIMAGPNAATLPLTGSITVQ
jgi:beta-glucosidase